MYANDSTLRNADESDDNREKLEFDGNEARSLNDYVDLGGIDCLQLDEDDSEGDDR